MPHSMTTSVKVSGIDWCSQLGGFFSFIALSVIIKCIMKLLVSEHDCRN